MILLKEIKPAVQSAASQLTEDLIKMDTEWNTRTERILKLREEQRTKANRTGFDDEQGAEMCDLVSELGSY